MCSFGLQNGVSRPVRFGRTCKYLHLIDAGWTISVYREGARGQGKNHYFSSKNIGNLQLSFVLLWRIDGYNSGFRGSHYETFCIVAWLYDGCLCGDVDVCHPCCRGR